MRTFLLSPSQTAPLHKPVLLGDTTLHVNWTVAPFLVYPVLHVTVAVLPNVLLIGVVTTPLTGVGVVQGIADKKNVEIKN